VRFEFRHALRYLLAKRGGLARLTTLSAVLGIAFGIACLIVVEAIYSGFREGVESRLLAETPHVTVTAETGGGISPSIISATIRRDPDVTNVEPVLIKSSVVTGSEKSSYGLLRVHFDKRPGTPRGVIVGGELARVIGVSKGERVKILFGNDEGEPATGEFAVGGIIDTGLFEYDSQLVIMDSDTFSGVGNQTEAGPDTFLVSIRQPFDARAKALQLRERLGPGFEVTDWRTANRPLFAALSFERRIAFIVFTIMVLLAAIGVAATLTLLAAGRRFDIAVLKTCGATSRTLLRMFFLEGLMIGSAGIFLGLVSGFAACWAANAYGLVSLDAEVYALSRIDLVPGFASSAIIAGGAFLLILPAIIVPVIAASRVKPTELLRTV